MKILTFLLTFLLLGKTPMFGQRDQLTDSQSIRLVCAEPLGEFYYIIKGDNKQIELPHISKGSIDTTLTTIDPKWIKRIDIYNGQKAIDLVGDKGKNGVIVIELKKGRLKKLPNDIKGHFREY